jgi:hypothetical protein
MAENGKNKNQARTVSEETLRKAIEIERIGNRAVHRAQSENRRRGIPNWYSIGGEIISDVQIAEINRRKDNK